MHASYPTPLLTLVVKLHSIFVTSFHCYHQTRSSIHCRFQCHLVQIPIQLAFTWRIFICLLSLHFCPFYYTWNHVTRILFCRDQVLAGITFLLWTLSWTTLHQNLSETYLLPKLYITSISPTILIFFGWLHEIEKGEKRKEDRRYRPPERHKIEHGFAQCFQIGRKCRRWIWGAGFSRTSADPPRRPGTHDFVGTL